MRPKAGDFKQPKQNRRIVLEGKKRGPLGQASRRGGKKKKKKKKKKLQLGWPALPEKGRTPRFLPIISAVVQLFTNQ